MRIILAALQGLTKFPSENRQLTQRLIILGIVLSACLPGVPADYLIASTVTKPQPILEPQSIYCPEIFDSPITNSEIIFPERVDIPPARKPIIEPSFHTCLVRITDHENDFTNENPNKGIKNEYSRVLSFNSDESLLLLRGTEGSWYLYDAISLKPIRIIPLGGVDPRWDSNKPNIIYYFTATSLFSYNILDETQTLVHDFSNDFPGSNFSMVWMRYEGSPSLDGRYWGLMAENDEWLTDYLLVYDQLTDKIIAQKDMRSYPALVREIDSVTISPLGNYFLVYHDAYCDPGVFGTKEIPCGLMVYDRNLQSGRGLIRIIGHSDLALDENGKEILIYQDIDSDNISSLNLATGEISTILPIDFSKTSIGFHFSGRAFEKPGWVVVSTYSSNTLPVNWMENEVFILETKPNGRIIRLAATHSVVNEDEEHDYWAEPQASTNRNLTKIIFGSNWEHPGTTQIDTYLVQIPENWFAEH